MITIARTPGVLLVLMVAGCSPGPSSVGHRLSYELLMRDSTIGDCRPAGKGCLKILVEFPVMEAATPEPLGDSVRTFVDGFLFSAVMDGKSIHAFGELAENLGKGFVEFRNEFPDYRQDWYFQRRVTVIADTCGIVSLRAFEDSYLGGAHPNQKVRLITLLASSGKEVKLADCLTPGKEQALNKLVEKAFRDARDLGPDQDLEASGFWFAEGKFTLPANIAVLPSGLLFYYNDYEIAPHSLGPTEVQVPFSALKGIVAPDGPLGFVMGN